MTDQRTTEIQTRRVVLRQVVELLDRLGDVCRNIAAAKTDPVQIKVAMGQADILDDAIVEIKTRWKGRPSRER